MSKKLKGKLLVVIALLFLCVVSWVFSLNPFIVKAESSETPIFEVVQNASVRVKTNSSGIRFTARINDAYLEQYPNASFSYRAKINAVGATDDAAQEVAVAQPDENDYIYVSVVYDNLRDDLKTAAYGVELYPEFYLDVTVNGETETVQATGEINRSMRAVAYDRYVNYTTEDIEGYEQELLLEYFSIVNQDEVVNYAFSDGKMIFAMPKYPEPADDEIVTAYVGSEKYTATYDAETKKYTATGVELELNEQTTIVIFGEDNTVYSTQVVRPNEITKDNINTLTRSATSGYYVLTDNIDMTSVTLDNFAGDSASSAKVFNGVFDGRDYEIKNFTTQTGTRTSALFNHLKNATIKNISFKDAVVSGPNALIAGRSKGGNTFENITVDINTLSSPTNSSTIVAVGDSSTDLFKDIIINVEKVTNSQNQNDSSALLYAVYSYGAKVENVYLFADRLPATPDSHATIDTKLYNTDGSIAVDGVDYYVTGTYLAAKKNFDNLTSLMQKFINSFEVTEISNFDELKQAIYAKNDGYFVLTDNITMGSWNNANKDAGWTDTSGDGNVNYNDMFFSGVFDGFGFTISDFTSSISHAGLFSGLNGGVVKNVIFKNAKTSGQTGIVAGRTKGAARIENVAVEISSMNSTGSGAFTSVQDQSSMPTRFNNYG